MKCDVCREKVDATILNKPKGTYLGPRTKRKLVCFLCQQKYSLAELKKKVGLEK